MASARRETPTAMAMATDDMEEDAGGKEGEEEAITTVTAVTSTEATNTEVMVVMEAMEEDTMEGEVTADLAVTAAKVMAKAIGQTAAKLVAQVDIP